MAAEPALGSFIYATVLSHDRLEDAICHRLAQRLDHSDVDAVLINQTFQALLDEHPELGGIFRADLAAVFDRDPACNRYLEPLLYFKGFHALVTHRFAHALWHEGRRDFALFLQSQASRMFAVDIHPAARFGQGIMLDHATGIVVGETAVVGNNCSFLHGVTLGGSGKETGDRHPKIGENVLIGAGAKMLGNITVGDGSRIAAGSVVLKDVPAARHGGGRPGQGRRLGRLRRARPRDGADAGSTISAACELERNAAHACVPRLGDPQREQGRTGPSAGLSAQDVRHAHARGARRGPRRTTWPRSSSATSSSPCSSARRTRARSPISSRWRSSTSTWRKPEAVDMPLYELDGVARRRRRARAATGWRRPPCSSARSILEEDASVWFGSVIRGDNEPIRIGARSNVQEGCVLHTDPGFPLDVGADCTIGHMVMLHGCTIGRGSLIGIGSILLNGAKIGEECLDRRQHADPRGQGDPAALDGAGLARKDRARSSPMRTCERFGGAAGRYVKNWKRFAAGLKPQA